MTNLFLGQTQTFNLNQHEVKNLTWCCVSKEEEQKCLALSMAVQRDISAFGTDERKVVCILAANKDDCMLMIDREKADITLLDAGEVFIGGRYSSLLPIMQEVRFPFWLTIRLPISFRYTLEEKNLSKVWQ